jgi:hypothetical protein
VHNIGAPRAHKICRCKLAVVAAEWERDRIGEAEEAPISNREGIKFESGSNSNIRME